MNTPLIGFLACLLLLCAQGQPANRSNKCKCSNSLLSRFRLQSIQTEPVIYQPSTFCPRTEIIITLGNKEKCVDPKSRNGRLLLKLRSRKHGGVHMTTASAQTSFSSSTAQQATSRL